MSGTIGHYHFLEAFNKGPIDARTWKFELVNPNLLGSGFAFLFVICING
jgi:hypothetical protein